MNSFANLKRSSGSSLEKLSKAVESMNSSSSYNDGEEKYWKPAPIICDNNLLAALTLLIANSKPSERELIINIINTMLYKFEN
jgi:hypothetical protein